MAKGKKEEIVEETPVEETPVEETPVEETPKKKGKSDSTTVRFKNRVGVITDRVYSKELHGDDHEELASAFAEKFEGTIV